MAVDEKVLQILREVIDPELGVNVVDLGLIYKAEVKAQNSKVKNVEIEMTLTTPGCPLGGFFIEKVSEVVSVAYDIPVDQIEVKFVWDPPWIPDMMSLESKAELGLE